MEREICGKVQRGASGNLLVCNVAELPRYDFAFGGHFATIVHQGHTQVKKAYYDDSPLYTGSLAQLERHAISCASGDFTCS